MSNSRHRHRKDTNHKAIVNSLSQIPGVHVFDLSGVGDGFPDAIVSTKWGKRNVLVEFKQPGEVLRETQQEFFSTWPGEKIVASYFDDVWRSIRPVSAKHLQGIGLSVKEQQKAMFYPSEREEMQMMMKERV